MARNRFKIETVFQAVDKMTAPVARMQNTVGRFSRKAGQGLRTLNRGVDKFSRGMKRAAIGMTAAFAISSTAMADVVKTGADFEKTLVSAGQRFPVIIKKGTKEFDELSDAARNVGRTTEFTASQGAESLKFLAKAGFDARSSMALLRPMVDFATAAELELGEASTIATETLGIVGLRTGDAIKDRINLTRVTDLLSIASNRSNVTVTNLFESFQKGGPAAIAAGQSIEDTLAIFTSLARGGIKEGEAGTATRNIILGLIDSTSEARGILNRLKIDVADIETGKPRRLVDVFEDFARVLPTRTQTEQLQIFSKIFGRRPLAAGFGLLREAVSDAGSTTRALSEEFEAATEIVDRMSFALRDTMSGSLFELKSAIESVKISTSILQAGPMREAIQRTTEWIRKNEELMASRISQFTITLITNFDQIAETLKKVGIGLVVFFTLVTVLKVLTGVLTLVNALLLANPIVLITIAIIALIAALTIVIVFWDTFAEMIRNAPAWVKALAVAFVPFIAIPALILAHWEPIKEFLVELKDAFVEIGDAVVGLAGKGFGKILDIVDVVRGAGPFHFLGALEKVGDFVAPLFSGGLGGSENVASSTGIVTSGERESRTVIEQIRQDAIELTIRSEAGPVEVTGGSLGPRIKLRPSGAF